MKNAFLILCSLVITLSSCAYTHGTAAKSVPIKELKPEPVDAQAEPYRIGAGDELELKSYFMPDINDVVQVRPDGKISVSFIQDIQAAGRTPEELQKVIKQNFIRLHVKQPDIVVSVNSFGSQRVYVGGEVLKPGPVQMQGRVALMQVLGEAGWFTPQASSHDIFLLRHDKHNKESVYHVDSGKIMSGEDTRQDVIVHAGDVILVPPSGIVEFDRWIEQNIRLAVPFNMGASYVYSNTITNPGWFR